MQERVRYCHVRGDSKEGESKGSPPSRRSSKRREQSVVGFVRYKDSACERKEKKKERFFISCEKYTINIVIDLITMKLIESFSHGFFPLQGERVFYINILCFYW